MDRLSDLLPTVLKKRGLQPQSATHDVFTETHAWLAKELPASAASFRTRTFQNGILVLETHDAAALEACFTRADSLRLHLHSLFPAAAVSSVRIIQSPA